MVQCSPNSISWDKYTNLIPHEIKTILNNISQRIRAWKCSFEPTSMTTIEKYPQRVWKCPPELKQHQKFQNKYKIFTFLTHPNRLKGEHLEKVTSLQIQSKTPGCWNHLLVATIWIWLIPEGNTVSYPLLS